MSSELPVAPAAEWGGRIPDTPFRACFDQSPYFAAILAPDGTLLAASKVALRGSGYADEEELGRPIWEASWWRGSTSEQDKVRAGFSRAAAGHRFEGELTYFLADGAKRSGHFVMNPILGSAARVQWVSVSGLDITTRVQPEGELAGAPGRTDSALIAGELGTYEWDVERDLVYGDANFAQMFSLKVEPAFAVPLSTCLTQIHPDDVAETQRLIEQSVRTGKDYLAEYRVRHGDGFRWLTARGRVLRAESGRVARLAGVIIDITDRKRTEERQRLAGDELQRQFRIYDTILSATEDFAYIFDLEGRFVYANRRLLEVWAKTLHEIVGKTCYELGYPTWHADMHMREIREVIATKRPIQGEVPFTGGSGISGVYDYIFTPVLGPTGKVEWIAGTTRDVTARKRRELRDRLLIRLDDATRPLTDSFQITQTSARLLGEALQVNRCAYADVEADEDTFNLTGDYNHEVPSIVGRYRFGQFGEECLRLMRAGLPYVVADVSTDPRTESVRDAYALTNIGAVICVPLLKANRFVAAMAVHQTEPRVWRADEVELLLSVANRCWESIERTRVGRVLAESEQRLQLAVSTVRLGVWDLDLGTLSLTSSDLAKANHGQPPDAAFTYDDFWAAVHPVDRERVEQQVKRAVEERAPFDAEYRVVWPDKSVHWISARGEASYSVEGTPLRMVGVSLDITSRKRDAEDLEVARRRLEEHARGLEAAVADRTAKLQETISELETFSYSISHDLRAPLRAMQTFASILASDCGEQVGAEGREYIRRIIAGADRMDRLIQDVLVYSRTARTEIPLASIELGPFLAGILESYPQFSPAHADFEVSPHLASVRANAAALTQCVSNLLGNAIKFVQPGVRPRVKIWTEAKGKLVKLLFADNGLGIDPAMHEKIFGIFYQIDGRRGGTGIGLSVVRKAAERMGGSVHVESSPGRGSTFWLELPSAEPE